MNIDKLLENSDSLSAQNQASFFPVQEQTRLQLPDFKESPAEWMYTRLVDYIKNFEAELDNDHEIGARFASFGQSIAVNIQDIGYYGPDIISFDGINEKGERLQLIQHISQLNVLLIAMKKRNETPRRIGFYLQEKLKKE